MKHHSRIGLGGAIILAVILGTGAYHIREYITEPHLNNLRPAGQYPTSQSTQPTTTTHAAQSADLITRERQSELSEKLQ